MQRDRESAKERDFLFEICDRSGCSVGEKMVNLYCGYVFESLLVRYIFNIIVMAKLQQKFSGNRRQGIFCNHGTTETSSEEGCHFRSPWHHHNWQFPGSHYQTNTPALTQQTQIYTLRDMTSTFDTHTLS